MSIQQKAAWALIVLTLLLIVGVLADIDHKLDRQYQVVVTEQIK